MARGCVEPAGLRDIRLVTDLTAWIAPIEKALKHDPFEHSLLQVVERVRNGEYIAVELGAWAVLIVEVLPLGDDRKALSVVLTAGFALPKWLALAVRFLKLLAHDQGCQKILVTGRRGWPKMLRYHGFILRASTLTLEVT